MHIEDPNLQALNMQYPDRHIWASLEIIVKIWYQQCRLHIVGKCFAWGTQRLAMVSPAIRSPLNLVRL